MNHGITEIIIGAAIEVHRQLGPGLLESTYEMCLSREFDLKKIKYERQRSFPVIYKNVTIDSGYRIDFIVENEIIVEIKSVESLASVCTAQLLTYLRLLNRRTGLLLNFNVPVLKDGIKRLSL